ncbi:MAG: ABC transporter ATP-binding protein [Bacteroidetes bacterium]|nr:ABC transporter ATP-binding protein [Bacteroidota bacterium]
MAGNELILDVKHLQTQFHTEEGIVKAVDDISFSINKGETIGIVGESGSGKSVTSLSIMGLINRPVGNITNGEILYQSAEKGLVDLRSLSEREMRRYRGNDIAMIFQEPMTSLNPVFTCGSLVVEAIILHQNVSTLRARALTLELFEKVKLKNPKRVFRSYPHQLSGGQKQRVMIAMAMSCNPGILIADEPTTALDVTVQKTILELINELKSEIGMSVIFITHDLAVIAEIADKVLVMYRGKIVEQGDVMEIFSDPKHPYTRGLLACRPPRDRRISRLPVIDDFMDENDEGDMIQKASSINEVLDSFRLSDDEIKTREESLYKNEPILQVKDLKTVFTTKKDWLGRTVESINAVDGVSFDVYPGETLGLVGESGCGKTTLGRSILRLVKPQEGEVIFEGRNINELSDNEMKALRKDMQIIFQDPYSSLNPRMTIGSAIMEPMKVHSLLDNDKQRKEKVINLLETVNMSSEHFNRYPHEFSGGQRQRICIARALSLDPKFIICDESVSALDVSVQAQVLNLLISLREKFNFTYIFISHDLSVVRFISDRMIVMNKGKIEEEGNAEDIYNNPQKEYTKKLISAIPSDNLADIKKRLDAMKN